MNRIALSLLTLCACAKPPPSKQAVAELAIRLTQTSSDAVTRALAPIDTVDVNVACDSGAMQVHTVVDGATRRDSIDALQCRLGDETFNGQLTLTTSSTTRVGNVVTVVQQLDGVVSTEGPTFAGSTRYEALKLTTTTEVVDGRVSFKSTLTGVVTVGSTRYVFNEEHYVIVDARPPTAGGAAGGGSAGGTASGGGMAAAGGTAGSTQILGASQVTDLAVVGERAFFSAEGSGSQPGIFSADATTTTATLLCSGPVDSRLAGLVVDGANAYALMSASSGATKLLRTSTTATGGPCQELGVVDARSFFFGAFAAMAKVDDRLVYFGSDGSLKAWSLTSNSESVVAQVSGGASFFDAIGSTGAIGIVPRAPAAGATPELKTFTAAGLGSTLATFSKPEFTTLGARVLWAIDGASGGVTFKFRDASSATETTGATAQLGTPGRINLTFCETNDGAAAGFAIAKSSDAAAGFYSVGADANAPRKITSQSFDAPLHCALTASRLWVVEGDFGGSRNLLRFAR